MKQTLVVKRLNTSKPLDKWLATLADASAYTRCEVQIVATGKNVGEHIHYIYISCLDLEFHSARRMMGFKKAATCFVLIVLPGNQKSQAIMLGDPKVEAHKRLFAIDMKFLLL